MNSKPEEKKYRPNLGSVGGFLAPGLVNAGAGLGALGAMMKFKPQPVQAGDEGILGALSSEAKKHGAELRASQHPFVPGAAWKDLDKDSFMGRMGHEQIGNMSKGAGSVQKTGIMMHPGVRSSMKPGILAHEIGHIKQPKFMRSAGYHAIGKHGPGLGTMYVASTHDEGRAKKAALISSLTAAPMMASEIDASVRGSSELAKATLKATGKKATLLRRATPFGGLASYAAVAAAPWVAYGTKKALGGYRPKEQKMSAREELESIVSFAHGGWGAGLVGSSMSLDGQRGRLQYVPKKEDGTGAHVKRAAGKYIGAAALGTLGAITGPGRRLGGAVLGGGAGLLAGSVVDSVRMKRNVQKSAMERAPGDIMAGRAALAKQIAALRQQNLSSRDELQSIINLSTDPRPRNSLGMFGGDEPGAPDPGAMKLAYNPQQAIAEQTAMQKLAEKLKQKKSGGEDKGEQKMSARDQLDSIISLKH